MLISYRLIIRYQRRHTSQSHSHTLQWAAAAATTDFWSGK